MDYLSVEQAKHDRERNGCPDCGNVLTTREVTRRSTAAERATGKAAHVIVRVTTCAVCGLRVDTVDRAAP